METPRNVVCLSNVPPELHNWLKMEALKMSKKTGKQVGLYKVVLIAIQKYKEQVELQETSLPGITDVKSQEVVNAGR